MDEEDREKSQTCRLNVFSYSPPQIRRYQDEITNDLTAFEERICPRCFQ